VTLTIVPRLVVGLTAGVEQWPLGDSVWQDTRIELPFPGLAGRYTNALTGEEVNLDSGAKGLMLPLSAALASFPVVLLERTGNGPTTSK
jgi:maltooligosyltrehalose synthase